MFFLVSNVSYRLLKPKIAVLTATVAVRSCTSWKNTSPELPHNRELQPNTATHHQFHFFDELEDDAHQSVLGLPAWLVWFQDQALDQTLEDQSPPPRVAFTCWSLEDHPRHRHGSF